MKNLLISLALRILRRYDPLCSEGFTGQRLFFHGKHFVVLSWTLNDSCSERHHASLTLRCVEYYPFSEGEHQ